MCPFKLLPEFPERSQSAAEAGYGNGASILSLGGLEISEVKLAFIFINFNALNEAFQTACWSGDRSVGYNFGACRHGLNDDSAQAPRDNRMGKLTTTTYWAIHLFAINFNCCPQGL